MIVVVGSHAAKTGKTTLICAIIASMPDVEWQAMKISSHGHHLESGESMRLDEQTSVDSTDTGRYLEAGARRAWWLRVAEGALVEAKAAIDGVLAGARNTLVESTSVPDVLTPDLAVMVIHTDRPDWKPSAIRFLDAADVLVSIGKHFGYHGAKRKISFPVLPPRYSLDDFLAYMARKLDRTC